MRCTTTNNFESLIIAPAHHTRHDTALPRPFRCRYAARPRASLLSSPRRSPFRTRTQRSRRENRSSSTASRRDRRWISGHGRTRTWRQCPRRRRRRAAAQVRLHPLRLPSRCRVNSAGASILTCPLPPAPRSFCRHAPLRTAGLTRVRRFPEPLGKRQHRPGKNVRFCESDFVASGPASCLQADTVFLPVSCLRF